MEYRTSKEKFYFKGSLNRTHYKTLPTYTYISLRHKAQKALTFSFRPVRFTARALRVARDCYQTVRLSSSIIMIILLHVVSGEPGLIPGRCQSSKNPSIEKNNCRYLLFAVSVYHNRRKTLVKRHFDYCVFLMSHGRLFHNVALL